MARYQLVALLGCLSALGASGAALRAKVARSNVADYTFDQYSRDFGRSYGAASSEYRMRAKLFEDSLTEIQSINARNEREGRSWKAGVHPFMDWSAGERKMLNGYKPSQKRQAHVFGGIQTGVTMNSTFRSQYGDSYFTTASPMVRQQANCGSCWAISAVEAVEAQLQMQGKDQSLQVSPQGLLDCAPNPKHCGGTGGCEGATGEIAYAFMRDVGLPLEGDLPYHARTQSCEAQSLNSPWPSQQRVRVSGWNQIESNRVEPVMRALVEQGPVVIAVDANDWFNYDSGIFDGCSKDATLGHAVLLRGYGDDNGQKYWKIQNSWGDDWGEQGFIRVTRHEDEDNWCGMDRKPSEGVGCDGGPPEVKVCGMCGLLYDPIVPTGVRLEGGDSSPASGAADPFSTDNSLSSTSSGDAMADFMHASSSTDTSAPSSTNDQSSANADSSTDGVEKEIRSTDLTDVDKMKALLSEQ